MIYYKNKIFDTNNAVTLVIVSPADCYPCRYALCTWLLQLSIHTHKWLLQGLGHRVSKRTVYLRQAKLASSPHILTLTIDTPLILSNHTCYHGNKFAVQNTVSYTFNCLTIIKGTFLPYTDGVYGCKDRWRFTLLTLFLHPVKNKCIISFQF